MKDIDFDELDRAVSSILGKPSEKKTEPETVNKPEGTAEKTVESVQPATSDTLPKAEETPKTAAPSTPLAIKRRGRFMDVMHPSATAPPRSPVTPAVAPTAQAPKVTLVPDKNPEKTTPSAPAIDAQESNTSAVEPASEPTAALDESKALIGAEPSLVDTPADSVPVEKVTDESSKNESTEQPVTESATTDHVETPESVAETEELNIEELVETPAPSNPPLQPSTPFLTEAKVDKRPLGGFPEQEKNDSDVSAGNIPDTQNAPVVALPRELQSDVMNVETAHETLKGETDNSTGIPAYATPVKAAPENHEDGRVEGHPLFDTSTYHEPIAAVHGRSTPTWVKWLAGLLICLAVGAGVGYFLFTAGL